MTVAIAIFLACLAVYLCVELREARANARDATWDSIEWEQDCEDAQAYARRLDEHIDRLEEIDQLQQDAIYYWMRRFKGVLSEARRWKGEATVWANAAAGMSRQAVEWQRKFNVSQQVVNDCLLRNDALERRLLDAGSGRGRSKASGSSRGESRIRKNRRKAK